jgi:hypothetical protein
MNEKDNPRSEHDGSSWYDDFDEGHNFKENGASPSPATVKIFYPWHPLYGQEVKVFGRLRDDGQDCYLIELPDHSRVPMPVWMADEDYCRRCKLQDKPVVSLDALLKLAKLLEEIAPQHQTDLPKE